MLSIILPIISEGHPILSEGHPILSDDQSIQMIQLNFVKTYGLSNRSCAFRHIYIRTGVARKERAVIPIEWEV